MSDDTTPQHGKAMSPASAGSVAGEPVAWAVVCGDCVDSTFTARHKAVEWVGRLIPPAHIVALYRSPTLTDAEREAIERAIETLDGWQKTGGYHSAIEDDAATLRGVLDRLSSIATCDNDRPEDIARLAALEQLSALDQALELEYGLTGNPMIKAQERTPPTPPTQGECSAQELRSVRETAP